MKNRTKTIISRIIIIVIIISMVVSTAVMAFAKEITYDKVLTLGANLSDEQRDLILNYLGITEESVKIITVTNEDERKYLEGIVDSNTIGTRTFSCAYIEPTESGGIHVKTVNLTWVTCDMLRNALITSGINNCNVIAVSPIQVSGTGSLTGIFKAYEEVSGEALSEEKKELAAEELVTTAELSDTIGESQATALLSYLKELVMSGELTDEDAIETQIEEYIASNQIELTEEQKWEIVGFLLKLSKQEYDLEEVKKAYEDISQTISDIKEAAEQTKGIIQKIIDWFKDLWAKITGTYEEIKKTEEYEMITEQLGILTQTNDELLGDTTVVTVTEDAEILDNIDENEDVAEEPTEENNVTFEDFSSVDENITQESNIVEENVDISSNIETESQQEEEGMLQYIDYKLQELTLQNNNKSVEDNNDVAGNSTGKSFDDLFK